MSWIKIGAMIVVVFLMFGCMDDIPDVYVHSGTLKSVTITRTSHWLNGGHTTATIVFEDGFTIVLNKPPAIYKIGGEYNVYKKNNGLGYRYELVEKQRRSS